MTLRGTADVSLSVTSFDPASGAADTDMSDGRAFVRGKAGRLNVKEAVLSDLGYHTGETSGASWMASNGVAATNNTLISDSRASGNGRHGFIFSKDCKDNLV